MPNRGKGKAAKAKIPAPKSRDPRADSGSERDGSMMRRGLSDKADFTSSVSLRYHHYEEYESWPNGALCSLTAYALSSCAGLCKKALSYRAKTVWLGDTAHPPLCPRSTCMGPSAATCTPWPIVSSARYLASAPPCLCPAPDSPRQTALWIPPVEMMPGRSVRTPDQTTFGNTPACPDSTPRMPLRMLAIRHRWVAVRIRYNAFGCAPAGLVPVVRHVVG